MPVDTKVVTLKWENRDAVVAEEEAEGGGEGSADGETDRKRDRDTKTQRDRH